MSEEEIVLQRLKDTLEILKGEKVVKRLNFQLEDMIEDCIEVIEKQQKEIKNLAQKTNELIDEYEKELLEKNNYIFRLENETEALHKLIDEEMG